MDTTKSLARSFSKSNAGTPVPVDLKIKKSTEEISAVVDVTFCDDDEVLISYEFNLIPFKSATESNDVYLVFGRQKMHVDKVLLSLHSAYFRTLFSENRSEIPIEDVRFKDFDALLKAMKQTPEYPNDANSAILLKLAERFAVPSVTARIEEHLLSRSAIKNDVLLFLADKHGLAKLLEKCIEGIQMIEDVQAIKTARKYQQFSLETQSRILKRIIDHFGWNQPATTSTNVYVENAAVYVENGAVLNANMNSSSGYQRKRIRHG